MVGHFWYEAETEENRNLDIIEYTVKPASVRPFKILIVFISLSFVCIK